MIDITQLIEALLALAAVLITTFVIPYVKSKTSEAQREQIATWTKIAVTAAEQLYSGSGRGEEKKKYVLHFLQSKGLTVDLDAIDAMIEAAVYELQKEAK